ncbi:hypothetical protein Droror1_Dr00005094 [Drosera rotundifolia]
MGKTKKELLASAPWRGDDSAAADKFADAKLRMTNQPGSTPTMHVPRKKKTKNGSDEEEGSKIDSEFRYGFRRNYEFLQRVFTIDTLVKPLPTTMGFYVARNLTFFTSIFTQFFDPQGLLNANRSLGLGADDDES